VKLFAPMVDLASQICL